MITKYYNFIYRKFILVVLVYLFAFGVVKSNDISAALSSDTNSVLIGEPVKLTITVNKVNLNSLEFPIFADTLNKLEILELYPVDTINLENGVKHLTKSIYVTSFEAGSFDLEPLILTYNSDLDGDLKIIRTNPLLLDFQTVAVDTANSDIMDIKPPIQIPFGIEDLLPYLIMIFGAFVIYYILILVFGKRRKFTEKQTPKFDPRIPADLEALEALQRLERENLWQIAKFKQYHSRLTDILRVYIHRRYHINALEMTSGELVDELKRYESNQEIIKIINDILNIADLAKFAKYSPTDDENINAIKNGIQFINMTKVLDIELEDNGKSIVGANQ